MVAHHSQDIFFITYQFLRLNKFWAMLHALPETSSSVRGCCTIYESKVPNNRIEDKCAIYVSKLGQHKRKQRERNQTQNQRLARAERYQFQVAIEPNPTQKDFIGLTQIWLQQPQH